MPARLLKATDRGKVMAGGSTLDPDNLSGETAAPDAHRRGDDTGSLGPSDSSDTGSDVAGSRRRVAPEELASDTDAEGTGERAGVGVNEAAGEDIGFDRAVGGDDAGLGTGLDEAELARANTPNKDKPDENWRTQNKRGESNQTRTN